MFELELTSIGLETFNDDLEVLCFRDDDDYEGEEEDEPYDKDADYSDY